MKKVYICSPLRGNIPENLEKVKRYTTFALRCGTAPVVPHFYAYCLNDNDPKDRKTGLAAGMSLLWFCDEIWVFGDVVSEGMAAEIDKAKRMRKKIRYFTDDLQEKEGMV